MKIGIVCPNYPPATFEGGVSDHSSLLAQSLLSRDHEVYALTSTEFSKPIEQTEGGHGVDIIEVDGPWNHISVGKIKKTVIKNKMDAIILQYTPASLRTSFRIKWALTRFPCQKVTAFHTLWGKGFDKIIGLLMLYGNSKIIATNSEIMAVLKKHLPLFLKKTYSIPIGSNILPCHQPQHNNQCPDPLIIYFGMLYQGKGLYLILDVLEELKRRGHRISFKFIGGWILYDKSYAKDFRSNLKERKLDGMAEYLGYIPKESVSGWLSQSRFVFLPYEAGLSDRRCSFMAAIEHGKAVLTSPPVVKMPLFRNGSNVVWPHEPSMEGYVQLIEKLLSDNALIARLETGAREVSRHFRWERIAAEYELALLHDQLENH